MATDAACRPGLWPILQCWFRWFAGSRSTSPHHDHKDGCTWDAVPFDAGDCEPAPPSSGAPAEE